MFTAAIVTLSDKGYAGEREDKSGQRLQELLEEHSYQVVSYRLLPDDAKLLQEELVRLADEVGCSLVLTTGGTGFSPRDTTPEATLAVAHRNAPGIAEGLRAYSLQFTQRAILSRGVSVIRNKTLIINLPGSVKAVEESMAFLMGNIEHGLAVLTGQEGECGRG